MNLDLLTDEDLSTVPKKAPRWKNRHIVTEAVTLECNDCGHTQEVKAGEEVITHCITFCSEAHARSLAQNNETLRYVGPIKLES